MNASIAIRRLTAEDATQYRDIRLEGLRSNPEAFGSTFEAESPRPLSWFADRLGSTAMLGAFLGSDLVGIIGLRVGEGLKERHKGMLVGMYVRNAVRRAGVGRRLLDAALDLARQSVELVQLTVVDGNAEATRLYEGAGFARYGLEKNALKVDGRYYDEILMAKDCFGGKR